MSGEPLSLQVPLARIAPPPRTSAAGVRSLIEPVYDRCAGALFRFFMVRTAGNHDLSNDLMQQLWLAALRNASDVPGEELECWLRAVARNLLATHWRRAAAAPPIERNALVAGDLADRLSDGPVPGSVLLDAEVRSQLLLALTELPAEDQELLIDHYVRSVPQAALAQRSGISVRAIEGRLYRARQSLRELLSAP